MQLPSGQRIAGVVVATLSLHVLIVSEVASGVGRPFAVLGAAITALLMGAVGEWLVHRLIMHRRWRSGLLRAIYDLHHRGHHYVHFTPWRYIHDGPINYIPVWPPEPDALCTSHGSRALSMAAQFLFYGAVTLTVLLPTALAAHDGLFTAAFASVLAGEVFLFVRLHDAVHYPGQTALDRLPFFTALDRHHYIHHVDPSANTNFLLPLGDLLFGTLRTTLSAEERRRFPAYEEARRELFIDEPAPPATPS